MYIRKRFPFHNRGGREPNIRWRKRARYRELLDITSATGSSPAGWYSSCAFSRGLAIRAAPCTAYGRACLRQLLRLRPSVSWLVYISRLMFSSLFCFRFSQYDVYIKHKNVLPTGEDKSPLVSVKYAMP